MNNAKDEYIVVVVVVVVVVYRRDHNELYTILYYFSLFQCPHNKRNVQIQPHQIQKDQNHHPMTATRHNRIPHRDLFPVTDINLIIKGIKSWKTHKEVNPIKGRPNCIRHVSIFKRIIRKGRNRQCFHKGCQIRKYQNNTSKKDSPPNTCLVARCHFAQYHIRKNMIGCKVKMRCKEHA